jgi:1,4-dihydroxy-2-naphthoate octaprenyltransferase
VALRPRSLPVAVSPVLIVAPAAWRLRRDFGRCPPGLAYNAILFRTFRLQMGFGLLLSAAALAAGLAR